MLVLESTPGCFFLPCLMGIGCWDSWWLLNCKATDFWEVSKLSAQRQRSWLPGLPRAWLEVTVSSAVSAFGTAQGELLHVFPRLAFHSVVWMCPWVVQEPWGGSSSWCSEIRQDVTSRIPELHEALACSRWFITSCLANTRLIFVTANLFTEQLDLMGGNRTAEATRRMLRRK